MLLFFSFNTNKLLEIIYTGIICWWLMGQALKIANIFGSDSESLPKTFQRFMTSTVKTATSVVTDYYYIKVGAGKLAEKIKNMKEKEQKPAETTTTTEANNNTNTQSSGE